jgi:hypothetical protein
MGSFIDYKRGQGSIVFKSWLGLQLFIEVGLVAWLHSISAFLHIEALLYTCAGPFTFVRVLIRLELSCFGKEILPLFCIVCLLFYFELFQSFFHFEKEIDTILITFLILQAVLYLKTQYLFFICFI